MTALNNTHSMDEVFRKKAARRRVLASLPMEEKLRMLVKMQQRAYVIGCAAGREPRKPWVMTTLLST
jgi:hypothetical protein